MKKLLGIFATSVLLMSANVYADDTEPKYGPFPMEDVDIREFVNTVQDVTGKTIIIDSRVAGKVNVLTDEKLTKAELWDLFQTVLIQSGFTAHDNGKTVRVMQANDIRQYDTDVLFDDTPTNQDIITRSIQIKNIPAAELVPILRPFAARFGQVSVIGSTNSILIVDHANNIVRLEKIIAAMDQAGDLTIEVVDIKEAWVGDIIQLLQSLLPEQFQAQAGSSNEMKLVADERSNRLIIRGSKDGVQKIKTLIKDLDRPSTATSSSTVIFLDNADAKTMAEMLKGIAGVVQQEHEGAAPAAPVFIAPDEDLNALVVRAEPAVLSEIQNIIASLDVPRAQVLIEAIIVEVNGNVGDKLGVQWLTNPESAINGDNIPFVASQFGNAGPSIGAIAESAITGGVPSAAKTALSQSGVIGMMVEPRAVPRFGAIIQALASQSNTNLLSTPSIMTLDNSEAYLLVGGTVPFQSTTQASDGGNPFTTIKREDVGTSLRVIPHIQNNDIIRLEVEQKVESLEATTQGGGQDARTNKREIKTEVLVENGQTIVLGGLMRDQKTEGVNKIPLLGDLPFLGFLFRSKFTQHEKVNLLVFIKPTIVKDRALEISSQRYDRIWMLELGGDKVDPLMSPPKFEELTLN